MSSGVESLDLSLMPDWMNKKNYTESKYDYINECPVA